MFEWAWAKTIRCREGQEELYAEFPSYRRPDVAKWSKWKFYPWCFLFCIPRVVTIVSAFGFLGIVLKILFIGQEKDKPLTGIRGVIYKVVFWVTCTIKVAGFGYRIKAETPDADYSEYLGPNYKEQKFTKKRVSTLVSNHITFVDILVWNTVMHPPSYACAAFVRKMPLGHIWTDGMNCVYIERSQDKEGLDKTVDALNERQEIIENSDLPYAPLCIFAEATVTNGINLSRFRRGAFSGLHPVMPAHIEYDYGMVAPDYCTLLGLPLGILQCSELSFNTATTTTYPVFIPNEYLFTEYAKTIPDYQSLEKWEIYAHAVNDFTRKAGNFGVNSQAIREKISLGQFVRGQKNEITINDKTFHWPPHKEAAKKQD